MAAEYVVAAKHMIIPNETNRNLENWDKDMKIMRFEMWGAREMLTKSNILKQSHSILELEVVTITQRVKRKSCQIL